MDAIEREIRTNAVIRLSRLFRVPVEALRPESQFGIELNANFVSDFRRNELDEVSDDIHDVADKKSVKAMAAGHLVIRTVADYCDHMVNSNKSQPKAVGKLLGLGEPNGT